MCIGLNKFFCVIFGHSPLFLFFFLISKNRYFIDEREVPKSTQGVDTKNYPSKKTRDKKTTCYPTKLRNPQQNSFCHP